LAVKRVAQDQVSAEQGKPSADEFTRRAVMSGMCKMRKVGFVIYPGYQPMGFAVTSPFEIANAQAAEPVYDIRMLSKQGGLDVSFSAPTVNRRRRFGASRADVRPSRKLSSQSPEPMLQTCAPRGADLHAAVRGPHARTRAQVVQHGDLRQSRQSGCSPKAAQGI
jgi:hypothetical protein